MNHVQLKDKASKLTMAPGVYLMSDKEGKIIYVGKAKHLKNRVSSYFRDNLPNEKTAVMVSKINDFDVILAGSEFEALLLENSLIKQHMPHYNILLKDDKGYPFVRLDVKSEYPRFSVVSRVAEDGARYFGPFGGRNTTKEVIDAVCKALHLPTCSRNFPAEVGKYRPCLNYHLGLCDAYCTGNKTNEQYKEAMEQAILVLEGKGKELCGKLEKEMNRAAEELKFELAAEKRDRLRAISRLGERQSMIAQGVPDTDIIGFYRGAAKTCFAVLHYVNGSLSAKDYELIDTPLEDDDEALSHLLRSYYAVRGVVPKTVCLPMQIEDGEILEQFISELSDRKVRFEYPQRGKKAEYLALAKDNAMEEAERNTKREERTSKTLEWLQNALGMEEPPRRIEACDISNMGNTGIVGSLTVFLNGKPLKKAYKRFKMKETESQNDYGSMTEMLSRRFDRYLAGDESFAPLPDCLFVDGGAVHAGIAEEVLFERGLKIPVFGMVKDSRHRTRALVDSSGNEIGINVRPDVFSFVGRIQEETHRFAIEYNKKLRMKNDSQLDRIPTVGKVRRNELLKHFKSIKAISAASEQALAEVVPKNTAKAVYEYFHSEEGRE